MSRMIACDKLQYMPFLTIYLLNSDMFQLVQFACFPLK